MAKKEQVILVKCVDCKHSILPIENYMIGCKYSRFKMHTAKRICVKYEGRKN